MSLPLLMTKLNIPPTNINLVKRERLLRALDDGIMRGHLLSLICAPTGYGKTTLASQWVHRHEEGQSLDEVAERQVNWLTIDQGDNDLARFITYLVAALQQSHANLGTGVLAALQNTRSTPPHVLATLLLNDFSHLENPSILVLEDYHTITTQSIQDFMSYFIDHMPQQLHLVIISRGDPPLPLARLRARGQLTEIRQADLAMTQSEINEFIAQFKDLDLSADQLQVLESKTEGWVAGLQLAVFSMSHVENQSAFIQAFSGEHEYIADYLTGEVLEQQDEITRNFLLHTSILNQLSAPLCAAITGITQAWLILDKLVADNLFIIPVDYHGEWYRYHALFADLLRKRLRQTQKDVIADLHVRAARWYKQNGLLDNAIEHYLEGMDYEEAARIIEENAQRILMNGQAVTFLRWLEAFPYDRLCSQPVLLVYQGVAMMLSGKNPEEPLSNLEKIASFTEQFQGEAQTLQALYLVMKGNAVEVIRLSESALQYLPAERVFLRILAADSLAMGHTLRGDIPAAIQAFEKVVEAAHQAGNLIMRLIGLSNLAGLHYQQGHLHLAWGSYQQVRDISMERLGRYSQPMGRALLGMGELAREWNNFDDACTYLFEAREIFRKYDDIGLVMVELSLARVYFSQGRLEEVQAVLEDARQHASISKITALDDNLTQLMQVRVWLAEGELDQVEQWAAKRGLLDEPAEDLAKRADRSAIAYEQLQAEYLTLVRLFIARQDNQKALTLLETLRISNEKKSLARRVIEILVLEAIAHQQMGESELALPIFYKALALAELEGYMRIFLDEGQPLTPLLHQAITLDHSSAYAKKILAGLMGEGVPASNRIKPKRMMQSLIEPVSERELEVLELIAEGLSNQEIALRLHISLSTVKGHTTNIYGKLGVQNRTQAVAKAQSLGLFE